MLKISTFESQFECELIRYLSIQMVFNIKIQILKSFALLFISLKLFISNYQKLIDNILMMRGNW